MKQHNNRLCFHLAFCSKLFSTVCIYTWFVYTFFHLILVSSTTFSSTPVSSTPAIVCQYLYVSHCQYFCYWYQLSKKKMNKWVELFDEPRPSLMKFHFLAVSELPRANCPCIKLLALFKQENLSTP